MFSFCLSAVAGFAEGGVDHVGDVSVHAVITAIGQLKNVYANPSCVEKIRTDVPDALKFCLENDLVNDSGLGLTTSTSVARVCALVFGRDEGGGFSFSQSRGIICKFQALFWRAREI